MSAIAHFERRLIAERTRDGIESARAKGKRLGRPPLDNEKLDAAFKLIEAGTSPREAARQLDLGRSTLYRELRKKTWLRHIAGIEETPTYEILPIFHT